MERGKVVVLIKWLVGWMDELSLPRPPCAEVARALRGARALPHRCGKAALATSPPTDLALAHRPEHGGCMIRPLATWIRHPAALAVCAARAIRLAETVSSFAPSF